MLSRLEIEGLAIIESLAIEFSSRFNVITGETGAGKSILIRALGLLLGARGSSEAIRQGRDQAQVTGYFRVNEGHRVLSLLDEYGIRWEKDLEESTKQNSENESIEILVRRVISTKSRFLGWINDTPVTATTLKEIGGALIDVFGQHDSLRLLDPCYHLQWLDQFLCHVTDTSLPKRAEASEILTQYVTSRKKVNQELRQLAEDVEELKSRRRHLDFLTFRCEELGKFQPSESEYNQLMMQVKAASQSRQTLKELQMVQALVDSQMDQNPPGQLLWDCHRRLGRILSTVGEDLFLEKLSKLRDSAQNLATCLDDFSYQIGLLVRDLNFPAKEVEEWEERLSGYHDLLRKLHVPSVNQLVLEMARMSQEIDWLHRTEQSLAMRVRKLREKVAKLMTDGKLLSEARLKAKAIVKMRLESELKDLAMPGAKLDVELTPVRSHPLELDIGFLGQEYQNLWDELAEEWSFLGEVGLEKAQFLLCSNPGEAMHPLSKIASGGEISRVVLALKKALSAGADSCLLVFDEIDTGISGRVADVVGQKIRDLSSRFQVICISHLAQVTAYCDAHFLVSKIGAGQRTQSQILRLSSEESEIEVARLISGAEVTKASISHAKALLAKARQGALRAIEAETLPIAVSHTALKKPKSKDAKSI